MRYGSDQKARTRGRVLAAASKALRAEGPDKLGVADVMRAAGLTHGGFYAHFTSKDDLLSHALDAAFDEFGQLVDAAPTDETAGKTLRRLIDFYLSQRHRDAPERGCPLPSLSTHVTRMSDDARSRYGKGVAGLAGRIEDCLRMLGDEEPVRSASSITAELIGAVTLARAMADAAQSDAILEHSRAALYARLAPLLESN